MSQKLIKIGEWAKRVFETPPCTNTLHNWVHGNKIMPRPKKVGGKWHVVANAEYKGR